MTPFQSIRQSLTPELQQLNELMRAALASPNALMNSVIDTYMQKKGKQLRPILVILAGKLLGRVDESTLHGAAAVELLHNASLIHDDVVDDTRLRRGSETINSLWDNHLAVLVGDFFLSNALMQSSITGDIRVVESISRLGRLLSIGELDEIYNARYNNPGEEAYFEVIYRKTASLFVSCVEIGAYMAGLDEADPRLGALREYARLLGLCFQIRDDIFDYFADETVGKPTGNDLREGKITLPLIHVLADPAVPGRDAMAELVKAETLTADEIARLTAFAVDNGGIEYARSVMDSLKAQAATALCDAFPADTEPRRAFLGLLDHVVARSF